MLANDIIADAPPRLAVIFEGVLGKPMRSRLKMYPMAVAGKWDGLAALWELQPTTLKSINQLAYRDSVPVDVYTFLYGQDFAEALALRFQRIDAHVANVWHTTQEELAAAADTSPTLKYVFDSDKDRLAKYGWRAKSVKFGGTISL